jgi:hypothetical protein
MTAQKKQGFWGIFEKKPGKCFTPLASRLTSRLA